MRSTSLLLSLGVLLLAVPSAYGQAGWELSRVPVSRLYFDGFGGYQIFDDDLGIDDEAVFGGRVGYTFLKHLAVEGNFSWSPATYDTEDNDLELLVTEDDATRLVTIPRGVDLDVDQFLITGSVLLNLDFWGEDQWFVPFVEAGGGVVILDADIDGADSATEPVFVFGGGFNVFVHPSVALRAEYKGQIASLEENVPAQFADDTFFTNELSGSVNIYVPFGK